MKVIIDGVEYVPVMESDVNMEAIARGLVYQFWGTVGKGERLAEQMEGLSVIVTDNGRGEPILSVLADIAREIASSAQ